MATRSKRHHYIPRWLLREFCDGKRLWVGFTASGEVKHLTPRTAFVKFDGYTRTDHIESGDGEYTPTRSDPDEQMLAGLDARTSKAARELLGWARRFRRSGDATPHLTSEVVETNKLLLVVQASRTRASQDRIGLLTSHADTFFDVMYQLAAEQHHPLPEREQLESDPDLQSIISVLQQNMRANFAAINHPILQEKAHEFIRARGLQIAITASGGAEFVIGGHGLTIIERPTGQHAWLPLAPDVAISLSPDPESYRFGICPDSFVEIHNKSALAMSDMIAGKSRTVVEQLLQAAKQ